MRNSHNITLTNNDSLTEVEDTTWSLPGAVVGFLSWLCALAIPMLIYGSNVPTRCCPGRQSAPVWWESAGICTGAGPFESAA